MQSISCAFLGVRDKVLLRLSYFLSDLVLKLNADEPDSSAFK